jgi:uncharacterized protein YeaO (DUF488 family)
MAGKTRPQVRLKRAYDAPAKSDGCRALVDRLWPRGVSKDELRLDDWLKEVAPSPALRTWFGHDPRRWAEFRRRYRAEIAKNPGPFHELEALCRKGPVTLVYAARDEEHNGARVLFEMIQEAR